jgi:hypothetical protein
VANEGKEYTADYHAESGHKPEIARAAYRFKSDNAKQEQEDHAAYEQ